MSKLAPMQNGFAVIKPGQYFVENHEALRAAVAHFFEANYEGDDDPTEIEAELFVHLDHVDSDDASWPRIVGFSISEDEDVVDMVYSMGNTGLLNTIDLIANFIQRGYS